MGYLRLVQSSPPERTAADDCVNAYNRELDYIFATLQRLGAAPHEVEDLAHEIFVVLYRNWPTLDTDRPLRPYIFGVAFRIVCAHHRRWGREVLRPAVEAKDEAAGPEASLQEKESISLLLTALKALPAMRRAIVVMHELDGVPIEDVARSLSITRFGAYSRLRKGRRELAAAVRRLQRGGSLK
jgi:RNA polymerase sigma-70 factor, ECF subfamily